MAQLDKRVGAAFYGQFSRLRPIQSSAIEPLINGRNLILSAGTGSGKTEAVMAPLISRIWRDLAPTNDAGIIYIAPTKALVNDIEKRLSLPLETLGLRIGVRHGDRDDLSSGKHPHVLLTTPESLDVLLSRRDPALSTVRIIVIDEVHLLYNNQRGLQLSILLNKLKRVVGDIIQVVMLSATISCLDHIAEFFLGEQHEMDVLSVPSTRPIDAHIRAIPDLTEFCSLIKRLIKGHPTKLLVFADARKECERLAGLLATDADFEGVVFSHYSSLSSEVRLEVERKFAESSTAICFATSTLELGIDIGDIDVVVLWGIPGSVESFLQRIGRGNRRAEKSNVICLIPDHSESVIYDAVRFFALIDAAKKNDLPIRAPHALYGAVAQQILGEIASQQGKYVRVADICELFNHLSYMQRSVIDDIMGEMEAKDYLLKHGFKNRYGAGEKLYQLVDYKLIYGNFGIGSQKIDVFYSAKHIGEIPSINLMRVHRGQHVRFAGSIWRVVEARSERIKLEPAKGSRNAIDFVYPGAKMGWDSFLTTRLWDLFHQSDVSLEVFENQLAQQVNDYLRFIKREWPDDSIPYLRKPDGICYLTFAGPLINRAIALISNKYDFKAGDIMLTVPSPIQWDSVPVDPVSYQDHFDQLFEANSDRTIYQSLLPISIQRIEYLQNWLKDETIPLILERLQRSRAHMIHSL